MSEFEAELKNSLRSLETQVSALSKGLGNAKNSANDIGRAMKHHFNAAEQAARASNREVYELGHALHGVGGVLGEIAHAMTGGFRFDGGLVKVALAASAAGLAFSLLKDRMAESQQQMIDTLEVSQKLNKSLYEASRKGAEGGLSGAESQAEDTKTLLARGGYAGVRQARRVAEGGAGISLSDATKGVATSLLIKDEGARNQAIQAAMAAARIGEGKFAELMESISKNPFMQSKLRNVHSAADMDEMTARLIVEHNGQRPTKFNLDRARSEIKEAGFNGGIDQANALQGKQNDIDIKNQNDLITGRAAVEKGRQVNETLHPETKVLADLVRETNDKLEKLTAISQTGWSELKDVFSEAINEMVGSGQSGNDDFLIQTNKGAVKKARQDAADAINHAKIGPN